MEKVEIEVQKGDYDKAFTIILSSKGNVLFGKRNSFKLDVEKGLRKILDSLDNNGISYKPDRREIESKYNGLFEDEDLDDILGIYNIGGSP